MHRIKVKIKDGRIVTGRHEAQDLIASKPDGDYALSVVKWDRTLEQNALYWKWLEIIGNDLGYRKEELHEVMLDEFAPIKTVRNLEGKPVQKRVRSSEMNVTQMREYMEAIDQFAAEHNIILPRPEEQ